MSTLEQLQTQFQSAVRAGALPEDEAPWLSGHFHIYAGAYPARLTEALADNYPVLFRALGDAAFAELAAAYLAADPSPFRSIRWFGHRLVDFIDRHPEVLPHPALRDIARMDWALRGAFDAPDAAPLRQEDLAAIAPQDWPAQRFRLHPSVRLLDLAWEVEPVWHVLNENPEAETQAPQALRHGLLTWRRGLECLWRSTGMGETAALRAFEAGQDFASACEAIAASGMESPAQAAASLLHQWIGEGLIAATQ